MSSITSGNEDQYGDSSKLAARARLHSAYTITEVGWFQWVMRQLPLEPHDAVLDVGCGPGWFWTANADELPAHVKLTLSDLSPGMVRDAMKRCSRLPFASVSGRPADAVDLPFESNSFDAVIAMHMLYHVPNPGAAIDEMHRVLKPGGRLAVTTNDVGNMSEFYSLAAVFGGPPSDPAGAAFGFETARRRVHARFGNSIITRHPAKLRITEPEDVFLALTSFPPGDAASEDQRVDLRKAIERAFSEGNGVLETERESGLVSATKEAGS